MHYELLNPETNLLNIPFLYDRLLTPGSLMFLQVNYSMVGHPGTC